MQMLKECTERRACGHLCESIHSLWEARATIAELAIRSWNISMGIINIAGEKHSCMHLAPVATHLLAVFAASIEIGYLVRAKDVVHVLCELSWLGRLHGMQEVIGSNPIFSTNV